MNNFFIIPSAKCQAYCSYCYSLNREEVIMDQSTLKKGLILFKQINVNQNLNNLNICFHGGEPLLAGIDYYREVLPIIREIFGKAIHISIQSNLWSLTDQFCKLFKRYNVAVGTSLDGPESICDKQRGKGYFEKTMKGVELLRKNGIRTGAIATFTDFSREKAEQVFDFFLLQGISFEVHAAIKKLGHSNDKRVVLNATDYQQLLEKLLTRYLDHSDRIKISTLDTMIKSISNGRSGLCTFSDCIGDYLAMAPDGYLYSCSRFVGHKSFSFGHIDNILDSSDIEKSNAWQKLKKWKDKVEEDCFSCNHYRICYGGCPYSGFAKNSDNPGKDPLCEAYKNFYSYLIDIGTAAFFNKANLDAISKSPNKSRLRVGKLFEIMNEDPHPFDLSQGAKMVIAAGLLGRFNDPERIIREFIKRGINRSESRTSAAINRLYQQLEDPKTDLNNLYLHLTNDCNMSCSFCYAGRKKEKELDHYLKVSVVIDLLLQSAEAGFKKVIMTGGEPLLYSELKELLNRIIELKSNNRLPEIILRTNLSIPIADDIVDLINRGIDQIVVSLDGTPKRHDGIRGKGMYEKTLNQIERLSTRIDSGRISIAATFSYSKENESESDFIDEIDHIQTLSAANRLNSARFLPVLPIGRAEGRPLIRPESERIGLIDWVNGKHTPRSGCGLGQVMMIDSDGESYPCHVLKAQGSKSFGNINSIGLKGLLKNDRFILLKKDGVDRKKKCKACNLRYICGGTCRIWDGMECSDLYERSMGLYIEACQRLKIEGFL